MKVQKGKRIITEHPSGDLGEGNTYYVYERSVIRNKERLFSIGERRENPGTVDTEITKLRMIKIRKNLARKRYTYIKMILNGQLKKQEKRRLERR